MVIFVFFVAHHMSTIEGGMVCTDDAELAEMLRIVRANGWDRNLTAEQKRKWARRYDIDEELASKHTFYELGFNLRPTEITGFLGSAQLKLLKRNIALRKANYERLEDAAQANPDLQTFDRSHLSLLSSFAFPVLCKDGETKSRYARHFLSSGVEIRPMIAGNIQRQPFYKKYIKH